MLKDEKKGESAECASKNNITPLRGDAMGGEPE